MLSWVEYEKSFITSGPGLKASTKGVKSIKSKMYTILLDYSSVSILMKKVNKQCLLDTRRP